MSDAEGPPIASQSRIIIAQEDSPRVRMKELPLVFIALLLASAVAPGAAQLTTLQSRNAPSAQASSIGTAATYNHCPIRGTVEEPTESEHVGDINIPKGVTYIIANRTFTIVGLINVIGGTLIFRNATLKLDLNSPLSGGVLYPSYRSGACVEFTDSRNFFPRDINLGHPAGESPSASPDNTTLYVNHSVMISNYQIGGMNVTVRETDSVQEGGIFMTPSLVQFGRWTRVNVSNSLLTLIDLGLGGGENGTISNMQPGKISAWDLHSNISVSGIPYDVALRNVTLVPNEVGPNFESLFGWGLAIRTVNGIWPHVTVINSRLTDLEVLPWQVISSPITYSNLGSFTPLNLTLFDSFRLVNTTVEGQFAVLCTDCNTTFENVNGITMWPNGRSNATFIDSSIGELVMVNCNGCTLRFARNSSLGRAQLLDYTKIPYYQQLPNASSYWGSQTGSLGLFNSSATILGNLTVDTKYLYKPAEGYLSNSTLTRWYDLFVVDQTGKPVPNATVTLSTPTGTGWTWNNLQPGTTILSLSSSRSGRADLPVVFNDRGSEPWKLPLILTVSSNGETTRTTLSYLTSTPMRVVMGQNSSTSSQTTTGSTTASSATSGTTSVSSNAQTATAVSPTQTPSGTFTTSAQAVSPPASDEYLVAAAAIAVAGTAVGIALRRARKG